MQIFAYLISKLLCNIYQSLDVHEEKVLFWNYHIVWIERDLFGKSFESAGQENYPLCVYPEFSADISFVISPLDWFTFNEGLNGVLAFTVDG